ncbi:MAG: glycosyltransferase [Candidatus Aenigmarchaeota archaeon]|nr:glycosyltransferase [Candidatus Aenigmarchaeota archaeon]
MKITILCNYYYPYSTANKNIKKIYLASSVVELSKKLASRGHDVNVITRKVKGTKPFELEDNVKVFRVRFLDIPLFRMLLTWVLFSFLRLWKNEKNKPSDLILCWDWSPAITTILYSFFKKSKIVCTSRNASKAYTRYHYKKYTFTHLTHPIYWMIEKYVFNHVDFLVYSSRWVKKTFDSVMKIRTNYIVLHHGVDKKIFNPKTKSNIIKKYRLKYPVIGFFGRFNERKGIDYLLKAVKNLNEDKFKYSVLLVGEGELKNKMLNLAKKLQLENVIFTGFVHRKHIPEYMQACDVIVLPSKAEGFSSVVLEAMAMGKVFVGTEVGGVPEIIDNWKNGVKIKTDSVDDIYITLKRLLSDKKLMKKIGKNAHKFIIERGYDWDKYVEKWEKLLKSLVIK